MMPELGDDRTCRRPVLPSCGRTVLMNGTNSWHRLITVKLKAGACAVGLPVALVALVAVSCTNSSSTTPQNTGTLIVHVIETAGPVDTRTGQAAEEFPMNRTRVKVQATAGGSVIVTTNANGDARLRLAPGVYVAQLADLAQPDGKGGGPQIECGLGISPTRVRVLSRVVVHAQIVCGQP